MGSSDVDPPAERRPVPGLWFEKRAEGFPVVPVAWQGRASAVLYAFLVLVAVITYNQLLLTVFVIGFYTVVFGLVLAYKSDLLEHWPPGE